MNAANKSVKNVNKSVKNANKSVKNANKPVKNANKPVNNANKPVNNSANAWNPFTTPSSTGPKPLGRTVAYNGNGNPYESHGFGRENKQPTGGKRKSSTRSRKARRNKKRTVRR